MAGDEAKPSKIPTIPSWQRPEASIPEESTEDTESAGAAPAAKLDTLEQARLFLQEESIKNASHERKVAFLEKKGLQADDIQKLLASEEDTTSSSTDDGLKTVHDSNVSTTNSLPSTTVSQPPPSSSQSPAAATITPRTDVPPVITYPEFLLKPEKPPPLVTIDRLMNAAYVFAGLSAFTYGASKYLVQPMLESLTSARHDLASDTLTSLTTLNNKLESSVSHVPYIPPLHQKQPHSDDTASVSSYDSDPTELFHRDIATQTSPDLGHSRSSSLSSSTSPASATLTQSQRLQSLHTSLSSLLSSTSIQFASEALSTSVGDLQSIIDRIESNSQPLHTPNEFRSGGAFNAGGASSGATTTKPAKESQSEAAKFKTEIRALKGALLSSRTFPTARSVGPEGYGGGSNR